MSGTLRRPLIGLFLQGSAGGPYEEAARDDLREKERGELHHDALHRVSTESPGSGVSLEENIVKFRHTGVHEIVGCGVK